MKIIQNLSNLFGNRLICDVDIFFSEFNLPGISLIPGKYGLTFSGVGNNKDYMIGD